MLSIAIKNKDGEIYAENSGSGYVDLLFQRGYEEGDCIELTVGDAPRHIVWQVDDAIGTAMCYVTGCVKYQIPFGDQKRAYSPKAFSGQRHYLYVREAEEREISQYRNLARNVADQHDLTCCYPHAKANIETRGESVFAARNAIDGIYANNCHGRWPFGSWGINRDPNAEMYILFGRTVLVDCIKIYLRADFPHDSYWTGGKLYFSDGSCERLNFDKTEKGQIFHISPREIDWVKFTDLIKAKDDSPFPALTQIEVYGREL